MVWIRITNRIYTGFLTGLALRWSSLSGVHLRVLAILTVKAPTRMTDKRKQKSKDPLWKLKDEFRMTGTNRFDQVTRMKHDVKNGFYRTRKDPRILAPLKSFYYS